ncbi:MAG: TlpA family protein disulfide reductase [Acidimicrobiales bacterium]
MTTTGTDPLAYRRSRHTARWLAVGVLAVLVAVAVVAATRPSYQATQVGSPLLGRPAPSFSGRDFQGRTVTLSAYRGRYVYVNFFASWCPPCQAEEPNLVAFDSQQHRSSTGAALISVVFNDSDAAAQQFVSRWGQRWPAVPDHNGAIANAFGVEAPPMTFLVNPKGVIVGVWAGPVKATQLEGMLAADRRSDG